MFNGITLWGNGQLIPLGPLREPLAALEKADVAIVHHANLVKNVDRTFIAYGCWQLLQEDLTACYKV